MGSERGGVCRGWVVDGVGRGGVGGCGVDGGVGRGGVGKGGGPGGGGGSWQGKFLAARRRAIPCHRQLVQLINMDDASDERRTRRVRSQGAARGVRGGGSHPAPRANSPRAALIAISDCLISVCSQRQSVCLFL